MYRCISPCALNEFTRNSGNSHRTLGKLDRFRNKIQHQEKVKRGKMLESTTAVFNMNILAPRLPPVSREFSSAPSGNFAESIFAICGCAFTILYIKRDYSHIF